jgi:hypothetical protein
MNQSLNSFGPLGLQCSTRQSTVEVGPVRACRVTYADMFRRTSLILKSQCCEKQ